MKITIWSDLHLEFNDFEPINTGADILCLAGDTCVAQHLYRHPISNLPNNAEKGHLAARYRQFFDKISKMYKTILMALGNHEHYSGRWNDTAEHLRTALEPWGNITLLDNAWLNFGNVRIVGTSLWTDLNNRDPLTMLSVKDMMNDYKAITIERNGVYHKLRAIDTVEEHRCSVELIKTAAETWSGDVVVLGHHAPSRASIHERYRNDYIMNGAFCSELDELMLDQENIKLWIHGHVHNCFDYMIGNCRVVCNPHGYPGETTGFNRSLIINV